MEFAVPIQSQRRSELIQAFGEAYEDSEVWI